MSTARLAVVAIAVATVVTLLPAPAGAVVPQQGKWYGVYTHYEDITSHEWAPLTDPLADGIQIWFTVKRERVSRSKKTQLVIRNVKVAPYMWTCSTRGTKIRYEPLIKKATISKRGKISFTLAGRRLTNPVLDPPVALNGWQPTAYLSISGRFSKPGFADGEMWQAVQGCRSFMNWVWVALRPTPSQVPQLTTTPAPQEMPPATPTDPTSSNDQDGEDWIGCHLLYCVPYFLPPFAPTTIPNLW